MGATGDPAVAAGTTIDTDAGAVTPFGDRLAAAVAARRSQLVLGLDPDPGRLWPRALELVSARRASQAADAPLAVRAAEASEAADAPLAVRAAEASQAADAPLAVRAAEAADAPPAVRAAEAVALHCALVIDAVADSCVAVKLQLACFERLGAAGWMALGEAVEHARLHELLVIADAKRGDIDVTAHAYAQALIGHTETPFGTVDGLGADAVTVNPLLGRDSLMPLVTVAREAGAGLFVLVRTSNPGAADVQEQTLVAGGTVSERLAALVAEAGADGTGSSGLADVGAVVGATAPERLARLREQMPAAVFLLPGVGAQGGRIEALAPAFAPGPAGGLVTVSRGLVRAHESSGGDPAAAAAAEAERLRSSTWALTG